MMKKSKWLSVDFKSFGPSS